MSRLRLRPATGIVSAGILALLMVVFASPGAMAAPTSPSHSISARPVAPHAIGAVNSVRVKFSDAGEVTDSPIQSVANNDCLNGTTALVYLTPCNPANNPMGDLHMWWEASEYDVDGYVAYTLTDMSNGLCLNGSLDPSHAEVILTECNFNDPDPHTLWYPLGISGKGTNGYEIQSEFENVSATLYCLNGSTTPSHAEVIITPCNQNDNHMTWNNNFPY
jgi:hypothetical protein